jgi:hypothetical protein
MNIGLMIQSDLRKRREKAAAELARIDAAIAVYGGGTAATASPARTRKKRRTQAQIDAIGKAQAARKASLEAKRAAVAQGGQTEAAATPSQPKRESHPRVPGTPAPSKGASLAEAAS